MQDSTCCAGSVQGLCMVCAWFESGENAMKTTSYSNVCRVCRVCAGAHVCARAHARAGTRAYECCLTQNPAHYAQFSFSHLKTNG